MGALRIAMMLCGILGSAVPARADDVGRWRSLIAEASARFNVPAQWVERVMSIESGGQLNWHDRPITSSAGAMGLMQLMPATWAAMRMRLGLGADPYDPSDNILAGTCYLSMMYRRFGYPGLFGAYNAGPGRYAAFLAGHRLPRETVAYLSSTSAAGTRLVGASAARGSPERKGELFVVSSRSTTHGAETSGSALFSLINPDQ